MSSSDRRVVVLLTVRRSYQEPLVALLPELVASQRTVNCPPELKLGGTMERFTICKSGARTSMATAPVLLLSFDSNCTPVASADTMRK